MPSPVILDVAIGIAFVYLFLSLLCSVVNEAIAGFLSLRAKNLVAGIQSLFSESKTADGLPFVEAIYSHGLIRGLYKDPSGVDPAHPIPSATAASRTAGSPGQASAAQVNPLAPLAVPLNPAVAAQQLKDLSLNFPSVLKMVEKRFSGVNLPAYIPAPTFAVALLDVIAPTDGAAPRFLDDVRSAISALPASPTKQALLSLAADTSKDLTDFQQKVENWYNDSMDRASGWYKRKSQKFLLIIGLAITLVLNVNTIKLAQTLWDNPTQAKATADLAENYLKSNPVPFGGNAQPQANALNNLQQSMPFPFGWTGWPCGSLMDWLKMLAGWLITTLALSLGAPFWFDVLNKFMVVRSTIKPHEKSLAGKKS